MGRELESRLEKMGIHKMSLKDMLRIAEKNSDTDAIARVKKLISFDESLKAGRRSAAKSLVAESTKKTVAKSTSKARSRSTVK